MTTIVCIGDSLVEGEGDELGLGGWVGRLAEKHLAHREVGAYRVYNLGIGGNTIRDVSYRLGEVLVREPDVVIIGCGYNDLKQYHSHTMEETQEHLLANYARMKAWRKVLKDMSSVAKVLVLGLHPVAEKHTETHMGFKAVIREKHVWYDKDIEAYNKFIKEECEFMNIPFLDMSDMHEDYYTDMAHLNGLGYTNYAERIWGKLKELKYISDK